MQGRVQGGNLLPYKLSNFLKLIFKISDTFIICDAYALPVEGTETRVNAGAGANEYMTQYTEACEKVFSKIYLESE